MQQEELPSELSSITVAENVLDSTPTTRPLRSTLHAIEHAPMFDRWVPYTAANWIIGPATGTNFSINILDILKATTFSDYLRHFAYFRYDKVSVKIVTYSPKNVVGSFVTTVFPESKFANMTIGAYTTNHQAIYVMSENSHLVDLGEPSDPEIEIPWQMPYEMLPFSAINFASGTRPLIHCEPMIAAAKFNVAWLTSETANSTISFFIKFDGLRGIGPCKTVQLQSRYLGDPRSSRTLWSRVGRQAPAALGAAGGAAVTSLAQGFVGSAVKTATESTMDNTKEQDEPNSVRPGVHGCSSSYECPPMRPCTAPVSTKLEPTAYGDSPKEHKILSRLSRPQYIASLSSIVSGGVDVYMCPVSNFWKGSTAAVWQPSWFNYYAQLFKWWSGGFYLYIYVPSHPLVECRVTTRVVHLDRIVTGPNPVVSPWQFNENDSHLDIFSGSKMIKVYVPYNAAIARNLIYKNTVSTYAPVLTDQSDFFNSFVNVTVEVVSCSTPLKPTIYAQLFLAAADDFRFWGFQGPKFDFTTIVPPLLREFEEENVIEVQPQMKFPDAPVAEHDVSSGPPLKPVEDVVCFETDEQIAAAWGRGFISDGTQGTYLNQPILGTSLGRSTLGHSAPMTYVSLLYRLFSGAVEYRAFVPDTQTGLSYVTKPNTNKEWNDNGGGNTISLRPSFAEGAYFTTLDFQPSIDFSFRAEGPLNVFSTGFITASSYLTRQLNPEPYKSNFVDNISRTELILHRSGRDFQLYVEGLVPPPVYWLRNGFDL